MRCPLVNSVRPSLSTSFDETVAVRVEHEANTRGPRFSTLDVRVRFPVGCQPGSRRLPSVSTFVTHGGRHDTGGRRCSLADERGSKGVPVDSLKVNW